jgi:hypothetical protein
MHSPDAEAKDGSQSLDLTSISASERRTLDAIFRHPLPHNLEWNDVIALFERLGQVEQKGSGSFAVTIGRERHVMHKPHTKDLASTELLELRHFLARAGWTPEMPSRRTDRPKPASASLLIAVDHHGARIYHIDVASAEASEHTIRPYDPYHVLHHMKHKDQSRERGQKPAEDTSYYTRIAEALATGGPIVVVGHGKGESNAAHHLTAYLREHHRETSARIAVEISADLSSLTDNQLLALGAGALHGSPAALFTDEAPDR